MEFYYKGTIPASKSIMNRALICKSYDPHLILEGNSICDDIKKMQKAVENLKNSTPETVYDCGAAGTVLRFLALRLSRIPGQHTLIGTERLMQRPQQDLLKLFQRLEVKYTFEKTKMILISNGWQNLKEPILVHRNVSSQFASGLILNSWNLPEDLLIDLQGEAMSEGYLDMTLQLCKSLGMSFETDLEKGKIKINSNNQILKKQFLVESDLSSLFAVAAYAVINGAADFENFPPEGLQPDYEFLKFFEKMGIKFSLQKNVLSVKRQSHFSGLEANLKSCPDLFPVLAVLCCFAQSPSKLFGAPQLVHKESNRIAKISELLKKINISHQSKDDGMIIFPNSNVLTSNIFNSMSPFDFDTDHDHRLAFASALIKSKGYPIKIISPEVVSKSFPEFWQVIGLVP